MSKIFGFCEAGCRREVVSREEYDQAVAGLAYELDQLRKAYTALEERVSEWKPLGNQANADLGYTYRIMRANDIGWGATITVNYIVGGVAQTQNVELPEFKHKQYFDIEFVDWGTDYQDGMGIVTYKIDGVEKTLEWDHGGAVISLENIVITGSSIYKYVFADNGGFVEEAIDLATEEILKGDY